MVLRAYTKQEDIKLERGGKRLKGQRQKTLEQEGVWGPGHLGPGCEQQMSAPVGTQTISLRRGGRGQSGRQ